MEGERKKESVRESVCERESVCVKEREVEEREVCRLCVVHFLSLVSDCNPFPNCPTRSATAGSWCSGPAAAE